MRLRRFPSGLLLLAAPVLALAAAPAAAQQQGGQDWFIPGQQRPQGAQGGAPGGAPAAGQGGAQGQAQQPRPPGGQQQGGAAPRPAGQRPPAPVIAMIDVQEVNRLSAAFNQVREEVERRRARFNEETQREQARWREEQQALAAARATLPPETLRDRERALQDRITDAQRVFRDRQRAIEAATQVGLQQYEQALGAVIRQVASSRGVNLVLPRPLIVYNDAGFDVTDEVVAQLNRVLRTVNLPAEGVIPGETPPPAASNQPRPGAAPGAGQPQPAQAQPRPAQPAAPRN